MKIFAFMLPLASLLLACTSGNLMVLSGSMAEKSYQIGKDFATLEISDAFDAVYSDASEDVVITADSKVMPYISVETKGSRLSITMDECRVKFKNGNMGKIKVVIPASDAIENIRISGAVDFSSLSPIVAENLEIKLSGASDFDSDIKVSSSLSVFATGASDFASSLSADVLSVTVSGASDMDIEGKTNVFELRASGASSVSSGRSMIETGRFSCQLSGTSNVYVKCTGSAEGNASGTSSVVLFGDCTSDIGLSGVASLRRK